MVKIKFIRICLYNIRVYVFVCVLRVYHLWLKKELEYLKSNLVILFRGTYCYKSILGFFALLLLLLLLFNVVVDPSEFSPLWESSFAKAPTYSTGP